VGSEIVPKRRGLPSQSNGNCKRGHLVCEISTGSNGILSWVPPAIRASEMRIPCARKAVFVRELLQVKWLYLGFFAKGPARSA
jgi:hypothetical protein